LFFGVIDAAVQKGKKNPSEELTEEAMKILSDAMKRTGILANQAARV
jgi:ribosomal protein S20